MGFPGAFGSSTRHTSGPKGAVPWQRRYRWSSSRPAHRIRDCPRTCDETSRATYPRQSIERLHTMLCRGGARRGAVRCHHWQSTPLPAILFTGVLFTVSPPAGPPTPPPPARRDHRDHRLVWSAVATACLRRKSSIPVLRPCTGRLSWPRGRGARPPRSGQCERSV